ncbi:MAG: hypothetical protein IPK07_10250 [Deltaproteobacteria bacterium]|nr:hypothetical protein [Deltaproteobacteria bacterium]
MRVASSARTIGLILVVAVSAFAVVPARAAEPASVGGAADAAQAPAPEAKLATGLYLVSPEDGAGRIQVLLGEQKYFIDPKPVVEKKGIESTKVEHEAPIPAAPGKPAAPPAVGIRLNLTAAGKAALADATTKNVGMRVAIVADGEVVAMPVIREPVTDGMLVISGSFTEERAKQLAAALAAKK